MFSVWALYFDKDDNNLRDTVTRTRVLQCSLERRFVDDGMEDVSKRG